MFFFFPLPCEQLASSGQKKGTDSRFSLNIIAIEQFGLYFPCREWLHQKADEVGEFGDADRDLPTAGRGKRKAITGTMGYSPECASGAEFIVSLQGQPGKLSDKKINGVLLDPCECG